MSENTGKKIYRFLKQVNTTTGLPTGLIKPNVIGDPDYVAPLIDYVTCPIHFWIPINQRIEYQVGGVTPTGYLIYDQRTRYSVGVGADLTEDNLNGIGQGPYFPKTLTPYIYHIPDEFL